MKSSKAVLCWVLALLSAAFGLIGLSILDAALNLTETLLDSYVMSSLSTIMTFAVPALLILSVKKERFEWFSKRIKRPSFSVFGCTLLCALACSVLVSLITYIWTEFLQGSFSYTESSQEMLNPSGAREWGIALLCVAVVPPLAEELFFRAFLQDTVLKKLPRLGIVIASLIFSLLHSGWLGFPAIFGLGVVLGIMYRKHGYPGSVLLHGAYNGIVLILSVQGVSITMGKVLLCLLAFIFSFRRLCGEDEENETDSSGV